MSKHPEPPLRREAGVLHGEDRAASGAEVVTYLPGDVLDQASCSVTLEQKERVRRSSISTFN